MLTSKEFCDKLREGVQAMVAGSTPNMRINMAWLDMNIDPNDRQKLTYQYVRNTMNREAEKHGKAISIKSDTCDDTGHDFWIATLKDCKKARIVNEKDVPAIQARAVEKFAKQILNFMPNVMHLEGEERNGALEGIALYQKMIRELLNGDE